MGLLGLFRIEVTPKITELLFPGLLQYYEDLCYDMFL